MSQAFSEEQLRRLRNSLPKRKSEKPEKLSEMQEAAGRLDRLGTPQQAYPPGSARARADSVKSGTPLASEVHAEKMKERRQSRLDKQKRLTDVRAAIRSLTVLLHKKSLDGEGHKVYDLLPGSEDRIEMENQRAVLRKERDELTGKPSKSKADDPEGLYP